MITALVSTVTTVRASALQSHAPVGDLSNLTSCCMRESRNDFWQVIPAMRACGYLEKWSLDRDLVNKVLLSFCKQAVVAPGSFTASAGVAAP